VKEQKAGDIVERTKGKGMDKGINSAGIYII
jgi:hypothetical protein